MVIIGESLLIPPHRHPSHRFHPYGFHRSHPYQTRRQSVHRQGTMRVKSLYGDCEKGFENCPIGIHHIDFKVSISFGSKDNPFTVRRP